MTSQLVLARLRFCWSFLRQRCPCSGRALQRAQLALRPPAAARAWATHGVEDQVIKAPNTASMNSTYRVPGLDEWPQAPFFIRSRIGQLPTVNAPLVSLGASSRQWCEARATLLGSAAGASTETCFVCCVLCVVCCARRNERPLGPGSRSSRSSRASGGYLGREHHVRRLAACNQIDTATAD